MSNLDNLFLEKAYQEIFKKTRGSTRGMDLPKGFEKFLKPMSDTTDNPAEDEELFAEEVNDLEANVRTMSRDELSKHLQASAEKSYGPKDPRRFKNPFVHAANIEQIEITNDQGEVYKTMDVDAFKELIMQRPQTLIASNEKMEKSGGATQMFYNTTLPALVGLAVNENTGEFLVVNTCPNAGNCKLICYARGNNFIRYSGPSLRQTRILNFLLNDSTGYKEQLMHELRGFVMKNKRKGVETVLRWNDSGDMLSRKYFEMVMDIARETPDVLHYAYTKEVAMVKGFKEKPSNFIFNYSKGGHQDKLLQAGDKQSIIVPEILPNTKIDVSNLIYKHNYYTNAKSILEIKKIISKHLNTPMEEIFTYDEYKSTTQKNPHMKVIVLNPRDEIVEGVTAIPINKKTTGMVLGDLLKKKYLNSKWQYNSVSAEHAFKDALSQEYGIEIHSILTSDELIHTPKGEKDQYNVIVLPGESDLPASRSDVLGTYLYIH